MQAYQTGARCVLAAICLVLVLGSCAARIPVDTQYVDESDEHARVVDLAFVTNRRLIDNGGEGERYYSDKPGALSAGRCRVGFEDGSRRGEVLRVNTVAIESVIPPGDAGRVVVYIHGYGESFERNCRRGALLKDRLATRRPPVAVFLAGQQLSHVRTGHRRSRGEPRAAQRTALRIAAACRCRTNRPDGPQPRLAGPRRCAQTPGRYARAQIQ